MFDRKRRAKRLMEGAARHLEPGESSREVVQTETGRSALSLGADVADGHLKGGKPGPHLLLATDRNVYAMELSGARLLNVGDVVFKVPLDQAEVTVEGKKILIQEETFHVMGTWGPHASRFVAHVAENPPDKKAPVEGSRLRNGRAGGVRPR